MEHFMYWCVCWQKIINLFFKLRWPIYKMIHSIQTILFVHKAWWESQKPKLLYAYTTDNNIFRSNIMATFSADQLPLVCFQTEDLRWFSTNLTPSLLSLWGLGWTRFCSACCPTRTRRPEWHFLQGQRYKVIHFLMPFKQGSRLADRRL